MRVLCSLVLWGCAAGLAMAEEPSLRIDLGGGTPLELVFVRAGTFTQGSPADEAGRGSDESPRPVRLTHDYYIGRTAVTRGQWERFVTETGYRSEAESGTSGGFGWDGTALTQRKSFTWRSPGFAQSADHPVCLVTFGDAQAFCAWLGRKMQRMTTLPTEAQWEYACRAGTTTPWHAGSATADGDRCAWHKGNAGNGTRPVDGRPPNAWGLIIGGNISEWCLDWYAPYQEGAAVDPLQENPNLSEKPRRVLRGGSWLRAANNTRSAARYRADPRSRNADIGFRIVCATELTASPPPRPAPSLTTTPVEAEDGAPPPPSPTTSQKPDEQIPASVRMDSRAPWLMVVVNMLLGGAVCVGGPIALIVMLTRAGARSKPAAPNPFLARPELPNKRPPVRQMDDGFWIDGNWPAGTLLRLSYLIGGVDTSQDLIYRPGPDGQFVYTGARPEEVNVITNAVGAGELPPLVLPPQVPTRQAERLPATPPPLFPPAY